MSPSSPLGRSAGGVRAFRTSVTLSYSMAGRTATTSASALAWTRHGNPSRRTPDACAERRVALVEHHTRRRVERVQPDGGHVVEQPLDARLVRDGRKRVRRRCRWVGRVLTTCTVHLVELLRLGVVRLHDVVADRPGRRDAVVVLDLTEVALAQPVEGRSVELGRPADEVVDLGLKRLAVAVEPPSVDT